jgi:hypothetical protein
VQKRKGPDFSGPDFFNSNERVCRDYFFFFATAFFLAGAFFFAATFFLVAFFIE